MPGEARRFLEFLEQETGVPIHIVSVGPEREQTLRLAA
jgi:adenylosuccinate synthase